MKKGEIVMLTQKVKQMALAAGADLVGVAPIERFDAAPFERHPGTLFSGTESVVAVGCRMVRGALKTVEEGTYWQAYNCDSYQYINEVLAPTILRQVVRLLEDYGYTAVPIHNPFHGQVGRPVREGGPRPDVTLSLRVVGAAAGLGSIGKSKVFLTPEFGPAQRMFCVLTDAPLEGDPLLDEEVCDDCDRCREACQAGAIGSERTVEVPIGDKTFSHAPLDCEKCAPVHQGWDHRCSPFLTGAEDRENPPSYFRFLDRRFRHRGICVGRGCVRACRDHLEKSGRLKYQYQTPLIEGEQWELGPPEGDG